MPDTEQVKTAEAAEAAAAADEEVTQPDARSGEEVAAADTAAEGESTAAPFRARHRKKLLAGAAGLVAAAVAGTVIAFLLPEETEPTPYTVAVTYEVTGEGKATITYNTGRPDEPRGREQLVELPWTKKLRVNPASGLAQVSLVLDEDGGKAQCAVAVRGRHRQRATAFGAYGRVTCSAKVPEKGAAKGSATDAGKGSRKGPAKG